MQHLQRRDEGEQRQQGVSVGVCQHVSVCVCASPPSPGLTSSSSSCPCLSTPRVTVSPTCLLVTRYLRGGHERGNQYSGPGMRAVTAWRRDACVCVSVSARSVPPCTHVSAWM